METQQIYVNIEELRTNAFGRQEMDTFSSFPIKHTDTKPVRTEAAARQQTDNWPCFRVSMVCLSLFCFLLMTAVIGLSVLHIRALKRLTNHTAEKHQLLFWNQNLTDERDQFQTSLMRANEKLSNLTESVGECPGGWRRFGCSCYLFSTTAMTWSSSRQECARHQAHLVIVNSNKEMMFLNKLGRSLKFWIGLSQSSKPNGWEWTDGTSLQNTYWKNGSPSRSSFRTWCAAFNSFASIYTWSIKSWTAEGCNTFLDWVCEKETEISYIYG